MSASLHGSVLLRTPNAQLRGIRTAAAASSCSAASFRLAVALRGFGPSHSALRNRGLGARFLPRERLRTSFIPLAASHEESKHRDIELERENTDVEIKHGKAWKDALQRFKAEALKAKAGSEEAYEIYFKKAMKMLMDISVKLKIQAGKAQKDLSIIAKEISEEGQGYLTAAANNPPDLLREILKIYASTDELKNLSSVRDFYLGIPYGCFLAIGGFIYFMLTGSIPAIRFGVILGAAIFALSMSSLRSWKNEKATPLLLIAQTAFSSIIFLRQFSLSCQRGSFPNLLMLIISATMVGFYAYRIIIDKYNKRPNVELRSDS